MALLVEHGEEGSTALILNRPTGMTLGKKPSGMPFKLQVSYPQYQEHWNILVA